MRVITERGIVYSNAKGSEKKDARKAKKVEKKEVRQEKRAVKKEERKETRAIKKAVRREQGGFFKQLFGKLKAKKNARKLRKAEKNGKTVYKDTVPPVVNGEKTLPDGSKETVPASDIKDVGGIKVDKKDISEATNVAVEAGKVVAEIAEENVTSEVDESGNETAYKTSDVDTGMSTGVKIGIGVGAAAFLGLVTWLIVRKRK